MPCIPFPLDRSVATFNDAMTLPRLSRRGLLVAGIAGVAGVAAAMPAQADLRQLVAAVRPSVLPVGTYSETDNPRFGFRGTGFVVGDGNQLVTNFHVLPPGAEVTSGPRMAVLIPREREGEVRLARVQSTDRAHDLALLRFDGSPLPTMPLAEAELTAEGSSVALIGFPIGGVLGFSPVTHRGIISSVTRIVLPAPTAQQLSARALASLRAGAFPIYQLDAVAYPGNSGGPLLDEDSGKVIGVINMVLVRGTRESALTNPTGISYAIPVRYVRELLGQ
jgi:S1-C subfamily serine protease